jgi:hypothetical protein
MLFEPLTWIGVYPAPQPGKGRGLLTYAALDKSLRVLDLRQISSDDFKTYAGSQTAAIVAINAPRRLILEIPQTESQASLFTASQLPKPPKGRLADRQMHEHNLGRPITPSNLDRCPTWIRRGFALYDSLTTIGYCDYPSGSQPLQMMEVFTQATFTLLSGEPPLPRNSLEGRLQRQLLLNDKNVAVPDPMRFFEEVTRYKLRNGKLPLEEVCKPAELDALAAAYTAWLAINQPERIMLYGDEREGQIVVPVGLMMPKVASTVSPEAEFALLENE